MATTISTIVVDPGTRPVTVNITGVTCYTTQNGSTAHTFPQAVTAATSYYVAGTATTRGVRGSFATATVSVKASNAEIATIDGVPATLRLVEGGTVTVLPQWNAGIDELLAVPRAVLGDVVTGGVTDNSTTIQNAIDALYALGGGIVDLPAGVVGVASTINLKDNVLLRSAGGESALHARQSGTVLKWIGSAGGTVVKAYGTAAGAADRFGVGGGLDCVLIDGNSLAAVGYDVRSWRYMRNGWVGIKGCTTAAHILSTLASTGGGDTLSAQQNWFERLDIDATGTCDGIVWDGQSDSNASLNTYGLVSGKFVNGHFFHAKNSDNNLVLCSRAYRNAGTGNAIYCRGHASSAAQVARSNKWFNFSASGTSQPPLVSEGTGGGITQGAYANYVLVDQENATALPTVSGTPPTAHVAWIQDTDFGCLGPGRSAAQLVVANDRDAAAAQAAANAGTAYSLIVYSTNSGNIKLTNGTQEGRAYVDTNGTHLSRVAGGTYTSLEDSLRVNGTTQYAFGGHALANIPTGWGAATGNATRTTFATSTVTTAVLAEHVKALIDDLLASGFIKP